MVLLGSTLYWADPATSTPNGPYANGWIPGLPLDGGAQSPVVANMPLVDVFAIDDRHVAWVSGVDWPGDIFRGIFSLEVMTR